MKILLIQPQKASLTISGEGVRCMHEPLALEYIASGVVKNHQVRILDMRIEKDSVAHQYETDTRFELMQSPEVSVNIEYMRLGY
jgi:hypothetical protein